MIGGNISPGTPSMLPGAPPPKNDAPTLMEVGAFDNGAEMDLQVGFVPYAPPSGMPPVVRQAQDDGDNTVKSLQYRIWPAADKHVKMLSPIQRQQLHVPHPPPAPPEEHQEQRVQRLEQQQQKEPLIRQPQLQRQIPEKWFYIDLDGNRQGPFEKEEMRAWFEDEYFSPELLIACSFGEADSNELHFTTLQEVFPGEDSAFL